MAEHESATPPTLRRAINLPMLVLYGLGTTIGAGIYALVGEIAGVAGYGAPWSFLLASLTAGFTACSFAELSARFPKAAGAALYVQQGFGIRPLAAAVGLLVVLAGVVSAAALANAFAGYLQAFLALPEALILVGVTVLLGALAAWGIAQSVAAAALITVIELGGLLVVIGLGLPGLTDLPERWREFLPGPGSSISGGAVLLGVTLAFYAFIGFEDMVDVAEEVKHVERTMPRAILLTLGLCTAIYLLLVITALLATGPAPLAASSAPIATLYEHHTGHSGAGIAVVAMIAITNGVLVQLVMASRVLYGLSSRGQLPAWLGRVNPRTRTPLAGTLLVTVAVLGLALLGQLGALARATSVIMLSVFALVNLALWRIHGRRDLPTVPWQLPRAMPFIGFCLSTGFVLLEISRLLS
jgi:basic amino acid/polyamine antiporter, APA family